MKNTERWQMLSQTCLEDEQGVLKRLRSTLCPTGDEQAAVSAQAAQWISRIRRDQHPTGIEAVLLEFPLSQPEGVALMCLAEALLRIPEPMAADELIRDLLNPIAWQQHIGQSDSLFVNAASWGLALTGRWLDATEQPQGASLPWLRRLAGKLGEPLLREALRRAMRHIAEQFVLGENLDQALARAGKDSSQAAYSFDMLGEAALTADDSTRYLERYLEAIERVGDSDLDPSSGRPSVSIKLSALHPRYSVQQYARLQAELLPQLCNLAETAATKNIDLAIDAEEADRLELSLHLFEHMLAQISPRARQHAGLVVQAYGKRALPTLNWLQEIAQQHAIRIKIRLVKGAYWDAEIKRAQQRGLSSYPVFTSKAATDVSYLACARFLLQQADFFLPQFATHNAITVAAIMQMQPDSSRYELQRLHGMGDALYAIVREDHPSLCTRIYAPIGEHRDLLPYLVRRLLENGANTSFMHQLHDPSVAIAELAAHPLQRLSTSSSLPAPPDLWSPQRRNSPGIYWANEYERESFLAALDRFRDRLYESTTTSAEAAVAVHNPADGSYVGQWQPATLDAVAAAAQSAKRHQPEWQQMGAEQRAAILERYTQLLIDNRAELVALMARETGKTLENGAEEVREAIDFARYYAMHARRLQQPEQLSATTGENNTLQLTPRGVFACISPWNFPLSIFSGQISAALAMGNAVLAKPAEQATLTAHLATELLHSAGVPSTVLHLLAGPGESVGNTLCSHPAIDGIAFTGGWETARSIQRQLVQRDGAMIPFIAETAGINALIADSSAQPQQLVNDVMRSAFDSAGQRCSALRALYLPEACAESIEQMLFGAMQQLQFGNPMQWNTDVGPIIDSAARKELLAYLAQNNAQIIFQTRAPDNGYFVPASVLRLQTIKQLEREAFGPILHIIRYREADIDKAIDDINALGFGLTCGIHSRNLHKAQTIAAQLRVGNIYINRDMIGAVVGAQPFGGQGKSGTGPKAGGPNYLQRFATEKTISINTAALGGDYILLST